MTALIVLGCLGLASASRAAPKIARISISGLRSGATTTLVVDGSQLLPAPQIVLPIQVSQQQLKDGATDAHLEFQITLPEDVPPGIYPLRVANDRGISELVLVSIDGLPRGPFAEQVPSLPASLDGTIGGSQILRTRLDGKQGQRLVAEVEARRLGSALVPVVRLVDSRGRQIAWSQRMESLGGDARIDVVLPADDRYEIQLHDALFKGGNPGHFRLKLGNLHYADRVHPLAVQQGHQSRLEPVSTNLGEDASFSVTPGQRTGARPMPAVPQANLAGAPSRILVTEFPQIVEATPQGDSLQQVPAAPVGINGRLAKAGEEDRYLLTVEPNSTLELDVLAARVGSPLDGVLSVYRDDGKSQLATNDDRPETTDPGLTLKVPGDVKSVVVALKDLTGGGGRDAIYHIAVRPAGGSDFGLSVAKSAVQIPRGDRSIVELKVRRSGFDGPIQLGVEDAPSGVQLAGATIPAGRDRVLVELNAPADAPLGHALSALSGEAKIADRVLRRNVTLPETDLMRLRPWLAEELPLAVTMPRAISLDWDLSPETALPLGGRLRTKVKLRRGENAAGEVRLKLLTNQTVPTKKEKKKDVPDLARALRLDGAPVIGADQDEIEIALLVPGDLAAVPWDLALQAELLAPDKKSVRSTAYASLRRLSAEGPLQLAVTDSGPIKAVAGTGETGSLAGKIVRRDGFAHPVTVQLAGLPEGYSNSSVTVPAEASEFKLPVTFAYGTKPGTLSGARLVASATPDPKNPKVVVRSNEVPVQIEIVPGEKPQAEPPLVIFEDDGKLVEYLTSGGGAISLESGEKHSGNSCIKVTPDQRFSEKVPSLGVKIRENPGPGEYRYLRFAWKKKGGASICLQINHDGAWGPGGSGREGAKFRYHAGSGGECYGASLALADKLPEDFVVVTRDLFADFGEFTFSGLALSPVDGEYALFDQILLGRGPADFELHKP